jgi:hypothetical protein
MPNKTIPKPKPVSVSDLLSRVHALYGALEDAKIPDEPTTDVALIQMAVSSCMMRAKAYEGVAPTITPAEAERQLREAFDLAIASARDAIARDDGGTQ